MPAFTVLHLLHSTVQFHGDSAYLTANTKQ